MRRESKTLTNWSSSGDYGKLKVNSDEIVIGYQLPRGVSLPKVKTASMNFKNSPIYHELFGNRSSQPNIIIKKDQPTSSGNLPVVYPKTHVPSIRSQQELSEKERTHKSDWDNATRFNATLRDKQSLTTEKVGEPSKFPSEKSAGGSVSHRIRSKCPSIGENYSKIKLCTVTDRDFVLLTQAKDEKTKRDVKETLKVKSQVEGRIKLIKNYLKDYDTFLREESISESLQLELLVIFQDVNCVCLQRIFSTIKVIETFMVLYDHHFQNLQEVSSEEISAKIIDRLKEFLSRAKSGAFELEVTEFELFQKFMNLKGPKRPFLNSDQFFKTKSIDSIVLTYLFLEYRMSLNLKDFRKLMSQVSIKVDNSNMIQVIDQFDPQDQEEQDMRTEEQKKRDEAEAKKKQLADDLARLRKEIQISKQGIIDMGGETTYSSKYLKCIEVCLNNKDLLFDIEADAFDKMVDLQMPQLQIPREHEADLDDKNRQAFLKMVTIRDLFADHVENEGAQLKKELDLFYNPVEDFGSMTEENEDSDDDETEEKVTEKSATKVSPESQSILKSLELSSPLKPLDDKQINLQ